MTTKELTKISKSAWWTAIFGSILSIAFGLVAILWPDSTLVTLVYLFGALVFINGIVVDSPFNFRHDK